MFTKEETIEYYNRSKVSEKLEKRSSVIQSLDDSRLKELDKSISFLERQSPDLVKGAVRNLERKRNAIMRSTGLSRATARKLQLWGYAQVTDSSFDLLLPLRPQDSSVGIGKVLFEKVSGVLARDNPEVTEFQGYTNIVASSLNYSRADVVLLQLSTNLPELDRYNVEFGVHRAYPPLSETPAILAVEVRESLRGRRGGRDGVYNSKIEGYIREHGPSSASDLSKVISELGVPALRATLYRMLKSGRLVKVERGLYSLPKAKT